MRLELPARLPYRAIFLRGERVISDTGPASSGIESIGSVVLRAAYTLNPAGGSHWTMTPAPDGSPWDLRLADSVDNLPDPDAEPPEPPVEAQVRAEADIAPYKPLADIAVEGYMANADAADTHLQVNGVDWLSRQTSSSAPAGSADLWERGQNLFGYQPRSASPRAGEIGDGESSSVPSPPVSIDWFADFHNRAMNFHRRGGGFTANTGAITSTLDPGQTVRIVRDSNTLFSLTLAFSRLSAMVCHWCGDGPDQAPYWKRFRLGPLRADTLILQPDSQRAAVLWRGTWPWDLVPADRYRAIRITED